MNRNAGLSRRRFCLVEPGETKPPTGGSSITRDSVSSDCQIEDRNYPGNSENNVKSFSRGADPENSYFKAGSTERDANWSMVAERDSAGETA